MIDQANRDEWADLLVTLAKWPTFWVPTYDEDDEWSGEWIGVGAAGEVVTFDGSDRREDFALLVASLVTCAPDMLAHIAKLESQLAATSATADHLETLNEAMVERARRHNSDVQAVVEGSKLRHDEDAARIKALEAGLREACTGWSWATVAEVNLRRIAVLRKLAGDP